MRPGTNAMPGGRMLRRLGPVVLVLHACGVPAPPPPLLLATAEARAARHGRPLELVDGPRAELAERDGALWLDVAIEPDARLSSARLPRSIRTALRATISLSP